MTKHSSFKVYLKMETVQPTSCFKIRGISHLCKYAAESGYDQIVCSSGGNAGLAAAYSGKKLGLKATIIVPQITPKFVLEKIKNEGADIMIHGAVWDEANKEALRLADQPGIMYIPPFDHPLIWEGHSSIVEEILKDIDHKPDAVVASVGGGGLSCGIIQGMKKIGWNDVPLVAVETVGADSFNAAVKAGKLITLPVINSVATCLGAKTVCQQILDYTKEHPVISCVVSDRDAVNACIQFADDHYTLVEPACGATLAVIYSNVLQTLHLEKKISRLDSVVLIVCGGNLVSLKEIEMWKEQFHI